MEMKEGEKGVEKFIFILLNIYLHELIVRCNSELLSENRFLGIGICFNTVF